MPRCSSLTQHPLVALVLCSAIASTSTSPSYAASAFDERGRLVLDAAPFALSLDRLVDIDDAHRLTIYDTSSTPMTTSAASSLFITDPNGLEGKGALALGGAAPYATMSLAPLPSTLEGRRVAYRVWQKPEGTRVVIDVYSYMGDYEHASSTGQWEGIAFAGMLTMRPTGRVTSDGWEEWSSGPVDFLAGASARPAVLSFSDEQIVALQSSVFADYDVGARALVDALEVVDLGPAEVPGIACRLVDESETCGAQGVCLYGRCVDARYVEGVPPSELHVVDYLERRAYEFASFEGGRLPQALMPTLAETLAELASAPTDARFFSTLRRSVDALRDGHASAPTPTYPVRSSAGICAHLGDADLVSGALVDESPLVPLVFSTNTPNPIAALLEPGDALVAIDGLPPLTWGELAHRLVSYPGDPAGRDVVIAPMLMDAALTAGSLLTFARCPTSDDVPTPCDLGDIELIDVDTRALLGDLMWAGEAPTWRADDTTCDYRFRRPVEHADVRAYDFAGAAELDDGVRALVINGVPSPSESPAWGTVVRGFVDGTASRLLLDERLGQGGSVDAVDLLMGELVGADEFSHMELLPIVDVPLSSSFRDAVRACDASYGGCAGAFAWELGMTLVDEGAASASRLAVLMALDVSGNDYVTRLAKTRAADTRVFGAGATYGAFGVIWTLPPIHHELAGGSFQVHDTLFVVEDDGALPDFSTGVGVVPDEVVYQTQSDAVRGVDTVLERARAWLVDDAAEVTP